MTANFSDFVERDGCARTALMLLLLTSVGCMTYTWGYYEGYHNASYSHLLLLPPPNRHGANASTHDTFALHHTPIHPAIAAVKSIEDSLPNSRSKTLPGSESDTESVPTIHTTAHSTIEHSTHLEQRQEQPVQHAEGEGAAVARQQAVRLDEDSARADAVLPSRLDEDSARADAVLPAADERRRMHLRLF